MVWQSSVIRKPVNMDSSLIEATLNHGHLYSTDTHDNTDTLITRTPAKHRRTRKMPRTTVRRLTF